MIATNSRGGNNRLMRIKVYAPSFADFAGLDDDGFMELPDGAVLRDVYRKLRIAVPLRPFVLAAVNYEWTKKNFELHDGDVVSFLAIGHGG